MSETALCRGGPLDGYEMTAHSGKGVILVDDRTGLAYAYNWGAAGFTCQPLGKFSAEKLKKAEADPARQIRVIGAE